MITARRIRERAAQGAAVVPPPVPQPPATIPYQQHLTELRALKRAHAEEVEKLRARIAELERGKGAALKTAEVGAGGDAGPGQGKGGKGSGQGKGGKGAAD